MNYIFYFLVVFSIIFGIINGRTQEVVNAVLEGADISVKIALSLIGIMAFWLGIMRIAEKSGLVQFLSKIIYPINSSRISAFLFDFSALGMLERLI